MVAGARPVVVEHIKIHGTALEGNLEGNAVDRDTIVFLPPSYAKEKSRRYPVVYALHGYSIGAEQWTHEIHVPQTIEGAFAQGVREMIVVLPDSKTVHNGSMYSSSVTTGDFEQFIAHDVVAYIDAHYRTIPKRTSRGLAGHSMGGYGALHLAFGHPLLFRAVSASSAALMEQLPAITVQNAPQTAVRRILGGAFGTPPDPAYWERESPLTLARAFRPAGLKISFDCGTQDNYGFDAGARELDRILTRRHIPHQFHLYPGRHDWIYFAQRLPESLEFQSRAFGLSVKKK